MRPPSPFDSIPANVINPRFVPVPIMRAADDWSNLTSDNSIQIVHLDSTYPSSWTDESFYNGATVSNSLKYIKTHVSPNEVGTNETVKNTDEEASVGNRRKKEHFAKTVISLDSLSNTEGDVFDARLVFSAAESNRRVTNLRRSDYVRRKTVAISESIGPISYGTVNDVNKKFIRNGHSESDLTKYVTDVLYHDVENNDDNEVERSGQLRSLQAVSQLIKPLRANKNKSKLGDIKKVNLTDKNDMSKYTSRRVRRNVMQAEIETESDYRKSQDDLLKQEFKNDANVSNYATDSDNSQLSYNSNLLKIPVLEVPNVKVAKRVRCGIRTIVKTQNPPRRARIDRGGTMKRKAALIDSIDKHRHSLTHAGGSLSEFLRQSDKSCSSPAHETDKPADNEDFNTSTQTSKESQPTTNCQTGIDNVTPRLSMQGLVHQRLLSTGRSNLLFQQCQRKLKFGSNFPEQDPTDLALELVAVDKKMENNRLDHTKRAIPSLGVNRLAKSTMLLDDMEVSTVRDIKCKVDKINKCSRIKTNGSLKFKTSTSPKRKLLPVSSHNNTRQRHEQRQFIYMESHL